MSVVIEIFILALFCNGMYQTFEEGMIFHAWGRLLQKMPAFVGKPLGLCPYCMASVYGLVGHFILWAAGYAAPHLLLLVILPATVYANGLLYNILRKLEQ